MKHFLPILAAIMLVSCHGSDTDSKGKIYDVDGITVLDLHGSWYQMGRQYGILAGDRMDDVLQYLHGRIGTEQVKVDSAATIAGELYALYPGHLKEFFAGASETSGLSLDELKLCNASEYVEGVFLCSAMASWKDYAAGKLVFGRNYDAESYSEIDRDLVVTVYHPDGGMAAATVGYAGEIYCVNGLNAEGIFVELNNGMPSAGFKVHWDLCPSTTTLFDMLFSARNLDDVDDFFHSTRSFASFIIGVADKDEARSYEWCYDGVRRGDVTTESGLLISTNHYVNEEWDFITPGDEDSWNSITRRCNLAGQARSHKGRIGVEEMKAIMSTPLEDGGPMHRLTRYQIVAVPEDLKLYVNAPCNAKWAEVDMKEFFNK